MGREHVVLKKNITQEMDNNQKIAYAYNENVNANVRDSIPKIQQSNLN